MQTAVTMRSELAAKIAARALAEGDTQTEVPGLRLYRRSVATACTSATYEPSLVVFVQGQKRINAGKTIYLCDGSNFLLTSVDLPVVSQVIAATQEEPILCLLLRLEMPAVREILSQHEFHNQGDGAEARAMAVGVTAWLWRGQAMAAAVIGGSIAVSMVMACLIGLSVPAVLHRLKLDPKIAAGPVSLALADICTLLVYLNVASLVL